MPPRYKEEEVDVSQLTDENLAQVRFRLPDRRVGELFGIANKLLGASRIEVVCEDGKTRMGRIPGKLRKRMWIREGDLLIIAPWEFQDDKSDIRYRFTKTQAVAMSRRKLLPKAIDIF
jgi:translation initiation factor 1A